MTTKRRPRETEAPAQGELEMVGGEVASGGPLVETEAEIAAAVEEPPAPAPAADPATEAEGGERLGEALERLESRVTLLVERCDELAQLRASALEARRTAEDRLARLTESGADPAELDERIRGLEVENARLASHAAFLEERIGTLLSRVRYVIEA